MKFTGVYDVASFYDGTPKVYKGKSLAISTKRQKQPILVRLSLLPLIT